jgi:spore maturation protein B
MALVSSWLVPLFILVALGAGLYRRVDLFGEFVAGAAQGLRLSLRILPYLIGVWTAVSLFDRSGALGLFVRLLAPALRVVSVPAPLVPLFLIRPLSGAAATALVAHLLTTYGPDSEVGRIASVVQASSETTLYVLTVYAVGVRRTRHALPACLVGDVAGFAAAVLAAHLFPHVV